MAITKSLTDADFKKAAAFIDENGIEKRRESHRYYVKINGKKYPPKYIIYIATRLKTGKELRKFNAVEAVNYFMYRFDSLGYEIEDIKSDKSKIIVSEDDEVGFPEGKLKYSLHRKRERAGGIPKKAKEKRINESGVLECDVCKIDFEKVYGERGRGFIEAHHTVPVSKLDGMKETKISDIALVCSNCHRMLHRGNKLLTIEELKQYILKK